jgi:hypothetical protein
LATESFQFGDNNALNFYHSHLDDSFHLQLNYSASQPASQPAKPQSPCVPSNNVFVSAPDQTSKATRQNGQETPSNYY